MENGFQGQTGQTVPEMTDYFVNQVSDRYIELYEKITGEKFVKADISNVPKGLKRIAQTFLKRYNSGELNNNNNENF